MPKLPYATEAHIIEEKVEPNYVDIQPGDLMEKDYGLEYDKDQFYDELSGKAADDQYFASCETRRFSSRKSKKIAQVDYECFKSDIKFRRTVEGIPRRRDHPPQGRMMLKQIFAGQYGLSFMATMYAMCCGRPLNVNMVWDLSLIHI